MQRSGRSTRRALNDWRRKRRRGSIERGVFRRHTRRRRE
jgi:hypothetical protein